MITDAQAEKANDYIRDNAGKYAKAKAERIQLQEFRKSKKALLMNERKGQPGHERESYAYGHQEYIDLLDAIKAAVIQEEALRWEIRAAELKIEMWRTQQANNRMMDGSHR